MAYIAYSFIGFEAAGSIAEEVKEARHVLPKAISLSLRSAACWSCSPRLGLILAIPDIGAVLSGKDANPIATTLETRLGSGAGRTLLIVLAIGFTSSMIAVQTAVTRAIWASARDRLLPGTGCWAGSPGAEQPAPVRDRPDR